MFALVFLGDNYGSLADSEEDFTLLLVELGVAFSLRLKLLVNLKG